MDQQPIQYAILRARHRWPSVVHSGLKPDEDGVLSLAMVPGPSDGKAIKIQGQFKSALSGLAIGPCNDVVLSDTANHQVIWHDGVCPQRTLQLGSGAGNALSQFYTPCGLLIHSDSLYVADSENGRVQIFRLPTLELRAIWTGMFQQPTGVAADNVGRIYVLDQGSKRIIRFTAAGVLDEVYNPVNLAEPAFLAVDGEDRLYVSNSQNQVLRFDPDGTAFGTLALASASMLPRALAARGDRVYVADADSGEIWVFDATSDTYLGQIQGYRGPVSAMAIGADDSLWIKPGFDREYYRLEAKKAFVAGGSLTTKETLDAGEETNWARVHVEAEVPPGTSVQLKLITSRSETAPPSEAKWAEASSRPLDTLVSSLSGLSAAQSGEARFLWIRVEITTEHSAISPRLFQVEAETTSPSYLDYLPAVYRREDGPTRFLESWLKLGQSEIDDWESELEHIPRRFDPLMTADPLSWLAEWLAFPLPGNDPGQTLRPLFAAIPKLYKRRGTPAGVCDLAELYTGVRPHLFEAFRTRRVWQLGETSALGLETVLPSALPDGMEVPGWTMADPDLMGLRGDYYEGINFDKLKTTRTDAHVDFPLVGAPAPFTTLTKNISVRWTGQLQPRSTDLYTFSTGTTGGVRLWVDGRLVIDNWKQLQAQTSGNIALSAGRWYPIVLEYFSQNEGGLHLYWSSRNQRRELIPQDRLYAVRDEQAILESPNSTGDSFPILVGQTVVGESEPLGQSEFGMPLFNETAHLFTVMVPAALVHEPRQRQALISVVEAEKPAHTDFHLCFTEARMRVGFQARIGIDSIVAGPPQPLSLEGTVLGIESYLGDDETQGRFGRIGAHGHIGYDTVIG